MGTVDLDEDADEEQTETDTEAGEMILGEGHRGCLSCRAGASGKWQGIRLRKGACANPLCNLQLP